MINKLTSNEIRDLNGKGIVRLILKNEDGESLCKVYPIEIDGLANAVENNEIEVFMNTEDIHNNNTWFENNTWFD